MHFTYQIILAYKIGSFGGKKYMYVCMYNFFPLFGVGKKYAFIFSFKQTSLWEYNIR